jgi:hypothetical protein
MFLILEEDVFSLLDPYCNKASGQGINRSSSTFFEQENPHNYTKQVENIAKLPMSVKPKVIRHANRFWQL